MKAEEQHLPLAVNHTSETYLKEVIRSENDHRISSVITETRKKNSIEHLRILKSKVK